jgi:hypothetical protein
VSGERPTFMRVELGGGHGETSTVSEEALWWPPGKIVGRYLGPFLAQLGLVELATDPHRDVRRIEIEAAAPTSSPGRADGRVPARVRLTALRRQGERRAGVAFVGFTD